MIQWPIEVQKYQTTIPQSAALFLEQATVRGMKRNVRLWDLPKGTAPEDPATRRQRLSKKTMMKIKLRMEYEIHLYTKQRMPYLGRTVAVRNEFFLRFVPPKEAYTRLEKYPPILWQINLDIYQLKKTTPRTRQKVSSTPS